MSTNNSINSQNPIQVSLGGTGLATTTTAYGVVCAGTSSTSALQVLNSLGSSTNILTSNGAAALPTWQAAPSTGIVTINGNSGSVTGATVTITATDGSAKFTGSGTTLTLTFSYSSGSIALGGNGAGNVATASGAANTIMGYGAAKALTSAGNNVAIGAGAAASMTTGGSASTGNSTFVGYNAGNLWTGGASGAQTTMIGYNAGSALTTGGDCLLIGSGAGSAYTGTEQHNLCIGHYGVAGESNVTRIGYMGGTASTQTTCFIDGINGVTVTGTAVLVATTGQLGVAASSAKYKDNIIDMGSASSDIFKLRPVSFNYKESSETRYGLVAEEVKEIYPNLITYLESGEVLSVMYHELPALMLNELQKMHKEFASLEERLKELEG